MKQEDFFKKWNDEIATLKSVRKKMITQESISEIDNLIRVIRLIIKDVRKIK